MPMEDRVSNVVDRLLGTPALLTGPTTIICHSLGGLIAKQVLLQLNEQETLQKKSAEFLNSVNEVVFLATPHSGATGATLMDRLRLLIWPTALSVALVADAPGLRRINNSYRTLATKRKDRLKHQVFFETQSTVLGKIVKEGSADPGLDCKAIPIDANHFTIAKPRGRKSLVYEDVLSFVKEHPPVAEPGVLVKSELPPYESERSGNYLGKAARVASLLAIAAVLYLAVAGLISKTAEPPSALDELTKAALFAAISDDNERIRVVGLIYHRALTPEEILQVKAIRSTFDPPPTITPAAEREIQKARTPKDLEAVLATIDIKPCGGSFAFQIAGTSLACPNGVKVPAMATANAGARLLSRDALVFHFTGGKRTEGDLQVLSGANPTIKVSVHLVVARSGAVVQLVSLDRQAWHAGPSEWKEKGITNLNAHSIGITLSNFGQLTKKLDGTFVGAGAIPVPLDRVTTIGAGDSKTYWETYTPEQISAAEGIVRAFRAQQPDIGILGHSDISPSKADPGPAFPIAKLRKN